MSSPSQSDSLDSIHERLGELQALASAICQRTTSRLVSSVFAQVSEIIWRNYGDSRTAIRHTCTRCQNYLARFDIDELVREDPRCENDIRTAYIEVDALHDVVQ